MHLYDCLRGALNQISDDVDRLVVNASHIQDPIISNFSSTVRDSPRALVSSRFDEKMCVDLSCSIASHFHLIWSVFQVHSGVEDEFIWLELKRKIGEESKKVNVSKLKWKISQPIRFGNAKFVRTTKIIYLMI